VFLFRRGYDIATRPMRYVIICLLLTVLCSFGFFRFRQEQQPVKLWLPRNSNFVRDFNWLMEYYGEIHRIQSVIVTADDVLQPHVLLQVGVTIILKIYFGDDRFFLWLSIKKDRLT
jgi:hypothetical protein